MHLYIDGCELGPRCNPYGGRRGGSKKATTLPPGASHRLSEIMDALGVAMEQADADGEDRVEAALTELHLLEAHDQELGPAGPHMLAVPRARGLDHLRRAINSRQAASIEPLADERCRDAVATADLEDTFVLADSQVLDDRP